MDFIRSGKVFGQRGAKNKENKQPASKSQSRPVKDSVICLDETVLDIINDSFGGQEKASGKGRQKTTDAEIRFQHQKGECLNS